MSKSFTNCFLQYLTTAVSLMYWPTVCFTISCCKMFDDVISHTISVAVLGTPTTFLREILDRHILENVAALYQ